MRRVFKTRHFSRWIRNTELSDLVLCDSVAEMAQGLIEADMGGSVVKKRIALPGRGKSRSARTLITTNKGNRSFFLFGFEKDERATVSSKELEALQEIATDLLKHSIAELDALVANNTLQEIRNDH